MVLVESIVVVMTVAHAASMETPGIIAVVAVVAVALGVILATTGPKMLNVAEMTRTSGAGEASPTLRDSIPLGQATWYDHPTLRSLTPLG